MSKIAIPAKEKNIDGMVDERFARADFFAIYDTETKSCEFLENNMSDAHGAGPKAVQKIADADAEICFVPAVGNNAFQALKASNIKVFYFVKTDSVKQNIENYLAGKLEEVNAPDK